MVEHRAERVLRVVAAGGILDRLADRDPERTRAVGRRGEDLASVVRLRRRARHDFRAVGLHEDPPVRLLVVAGADHVDLDLEPEVGPGEREGTPPLAGSRLGRQAAHALLLVVVGLRERRVRLVAAGRAHALVLVVDVGRRIEGLLEPVGAIQRARAVEPVRVADRLGDLDLALGTDLLADERHREQRREVVRAERPERARMQIRRRRHGEVRGDVVPGPRDPQFIEYELRLPRIGRRHGDLLCQAANREREPSARVTAGATAASIRAARSGPVRRR